MTVEEALEKGFELEGARDVLLDFDELASGELFPARPDASIVAEATEEKLDFGEGVAHVGAEADQEPARESIAGKTGRAAEARGRGAGLDVRRKTREAGGHGAKQVLLQHQGADGRRAGAAQTIERKIDGGAEGDRGDGKRVRVSIQPR